LSTPLPISPEIKPLGLLPLHVEATDEEVKRALYEKYSDAIKRALGLNLV